MAHSPRAPRLRCRAAVLAALAVGAGLLVGPPAAADDVAPAAATGGHARKYVAARYRAFAAALDVPTGWTGSVSSCTTGGESARSRQATAAAVNVARWVARLEPVELVASGDARSAALLMQANGSLSHAPDPSGFPRCWSSTGAAAAGRSNLALGTSGARAISAYLDEPGDGNYAAGHRRWILNPAATRLATGSTSGANALTVFGLDAPSSRAKSPAWIAWPASGWFPSQLEPDGRWSLSASDGSRHFDRATVRVEVIDAHGRLVRRLPVRVQPVRDGYGPNTLVFEVGGLRVPTGKKVVRYRVTVSGITDDDAPGRTFTRTYKVRLFDGTR